MRPLENVRVVTMALNAPGPVAAWRLRAAGATVIKVEPPGGDPLENYASGWYHELHQDITIERIDLKSAGGAGRMRTLLTNADLFLASQRPAALQRLRLDKDTLMDCGASPRLRWLNIVGELDAPEVPGHDLTYLAKAGLLGSELPRTVFADVLAGMEAYATALLLLQSPPGSFAQVGLFDALSALVAPMRHGLTGPGSMLGGALPAYAIYETQAGRIAVAALEPHFRRRLYDELERPVDTALDHIFKSRTADEWENWAKARDLPIAAMR
jgi:alpha-methylacyl-CoA racemase